MVPGGVDLKVASEVALSDNSTAVVSEELEVVYLGKLSVLQLVGVMVAWKDFCSAKNLAVWTEYR